MNKLKYSVKRILNEPIFVLFFATLVLCFYPGDIFAATPVALEASQIKEEAQVDTSSAGLVAKVAPGELLPVSISLLNFGGNRKVDVELRYAIFSSVGEEIQSSKDTIAVETTANFVKTLQIPFSTKPGIYIVRTSIFYKDQIVPATTEFPFTVEYKILGLFQDDFFLYGGVTILIAVFMGYIGHILVKHRRLARLVHLDYSYVPHSKRVFYELLSDTIMEMRERVGDVALAVASHIEGLQIDEETGRILKLSGSPSKIIAELVSGYEKALDQKVSFTFRKENKK